MQTHFVLFFFVDLSFLRNSNPMDSALLPLFVCGVMSAFDDVSFSDLQYSTVQCSAVQCSAVQCSAVQCSAVQCRVVQCSAVQCSAVQYSTFVVTLTSFGFAHCVPVEV